MYIVCHSGLSGMTGEKVKRETKDDMKDKTKFLDAAIEKAVHY